MGGESLLPSDRHAIYKALSFQMLNDELFVASFARFAGRVQVVSGSNAVYEQDVPAGVTMMRVPMAAGNQEFHFTTESGTDVKGASPQHVRSSCIVSFRYAGRLLQVLMGTRRCRTASIIITSSADS